MNAFPKKHQWECEELRNGFDENSQFATLMQAALVRVLAAKGPAAPVQAEGLVPSTTKTISFVGSF